MRLSGSCFLLLAGLPTPLTSPVCWEISGDISSSPTSGGTFLPGLVPILKDLLETAKGGEREGLGRETERKRGKGKEEQGKQKEKLKNKPKGRGRERERKQV